MKLLLDTHAFLWWLFDDPQLSSRARQLVADPSNQVLVSAASAWEISTKFRLGKLPAAKTLVHDISAWVKKARFCELGVTIAHGQRAGNYRQAHRDPFDRMLAAQTEIEGLSLVSCDSALRDFGINLLW